ncbi:MAG: glycosyltransferase [Bacteroidetes bacterium 4572_128]|nr:MAG: glycosyltransferase [Bacteroidetes bacterium 4572_128]
MKFSVVIPTYKCSYFLNELYERLVKTLTKTLHDFEIIYVNDASPENDWEIITELSKKDDRVKAINFSRNFGQHYAINAGLNYSSGDWVIVMDGDLQDKPEEIIKLYNKTKEGFEIVFAKRKNRKDKFFKIVLSKLFYKIFAYLTGTEQDSSVANFGIYNKKVINAILSMKDSIKYFPTMTQWVGFKKTKIFVEHSKTFSTKPLKLFVKFGFFIVLCSVLFAIYFLIKYLKGEIVVMGYASLIISIWLLSGIIILIMGVLGIYIGKIFERVKDRPNFIIEEKINF